MSSSEIRPRFEVYVAASLDAVMTSIETHLERCGGTYRGWVEAPYAELRVPTDQRHIGSPRLAVYADELVDGINLRCRLQPEPDVWTAYVAIASALAIAALAALSYGISQWVMGETPWVALIGLPLVLVLGVAQYVAALMGQKLGHAQMKFLRRQLLDALADLSPRL